MSIPRGWRGPAEESPYNGLREDLLVGSPSNRIRFDGIFDGTVSSGLGDPRQAQLGVKLIF